MSSRSVISMFNNTCQVLNTKLVWPAKALQTRLGLRTDLLPKCLSTPLNFCTMIVLMFFTSVSFANNLVCNLFGILYPMIYGLSVVNDTTNTNKSTTFNKYWMLFGMITLIDSLFGFVLHNIPGYFYLKIGFVYSLIRKDFALVDVIYDKITKRFTKKVDMNAFAGVARSLCVKPIGDRLGAIETNTPSVTEINTPSAVETNAPSVTETNCWEKMSTDHILKCMNEDNAVETNESNVTETNESNAEEINESDESDVTETNN